MKVREIESSDVSTAADIADAAFSKDELFAWLYPHYDRYPGTVRRWWLQRLRQRMVEPSVKMFVAEMDGEVVGYAIWKRVGEGSYTAKWMNDSLISRLERLLLSVEMRYLNFLDKAVDPKALKQYLSMTDFSFYKTLAKTGFLHLSGLAVSPKHQRKGIGRELIRWGLGEAEHERIPVTLEASMSGRALYSKLGFLTIERQKIKDDLAGIAMLWEPPVLKGKWLDLDSDGNAELKSLS